jgi:hypothetical protein
MNTKYISILRKGSFVQMDFGDMDLIEARFEIQKLNERIQSGENILYEGVKVLYAKVIGDKIYLKLEN